MGLFEQEIAISARPDGPSRTVSALVDTGAIYTWIPGSILSDLGVDREFRREFELADGTPIERDMATIHVRINGREHPTPCIFGDEGTDALLGVVTLEELGFGVDPVNRRLIPIRGKLAALRHRRVEASEPNSAPECRLTREDGQRRQADTGKLFAQLAEQRQAGAANEFVFRGDHGALWHEVSHFVDEESLCCPFYTYEQIEIADGVILRVIGQPEPIESR